MSHSLLFRKGHHSRKIPNINQTLKVVKAKVRSWKQPIRADQNNHLQAVQTRIMTVKRRIRYQEDMLEKRDNFQKKVDKSSSFNLETEISKLKVLIALTELVKNNNYKSDIVKMLKVDHMSDMVNIEDDQPELIFDPSIDGHSGDSDVPFYPSLRIHQFILHNSILDFRASHNLTPKAIMERLGLDITCEYHDLYSFDSSKVRCLGLIKDLVVSLDQIPAKNVFIDVVVADMPPWFGMLLSRSWGAKLRGTL